jgi:imidazolonepropionase-like amidohydrolase
MSKFQGWGRASAAVLLAVVVLVPSLEADDSLHRVWAIKDCRVVLPAGPAIEQATIIIRDGLIEAVGKGVAVPPDAEVIDGSKLTATPGLIDGLSKSLLKLPEEKLDMTKFYTGDFTDKDKGITPEFKAFDYVNLGKATLEKYYKHGFTAAQVMHDRGILTGRSAFVSLSDPDKNKALIPATACMGIGFSPSGVSAYPNSLMGVQAYLRQMFQDAAYYDMNLRRWLEAPAGTRRPDHSPALEVLADYATGRKPVIFLCRNQYDIRRALVLASDQKLDYLICDWGGEAAEVIPELKKAGARVLCAVAFKVPTSSLYAQKGRAERERAEKEVYPRNPARLAEAGVPFAFSSLGTDDPKSFTEGVLKAVEAGLPKDKALAALTSVPSAFFGLGKALGSLETGKLANIVLTEGELLIKDPKVKVVFVDGRKWEPKDTAGKTGEAPTVNVSGKWEIEAEGAPKLTVEYVQEGSDLSGKMVTPFGVFEFTGGSVSGNTISLEMTLSVGGQDIDLYISGTVEGDTTRGTIVQGTSGSIEYTAKRIPG